MKNFIRLFSIFISHLLKGQFKLSSMIESLLIAKEIPHGHSWTLLSRLGEMLTLAEKMFGERNKYYTLLGIEFNRTGPRIWYPGSSTNIIIQLSLDSLESERCALYELSHECIHLLSPSGGAHANVLEEGLATAFSWSYVLKTLKYDYHKRTNNRRYQKAGMLVERVLEIRPDFVRELRKACPNIYRADTITVKKLAPFLLDEEVSFLCSKF